MIAQPSPQTASDASRSRAPAAPLREPAPPPRAHWRAAILPTVGTFLVLAAAVIWNVFDETLQQHITTGWAVTIGLVMAALVSSLVFYAFRGQAIRDAADLEHLRALEKLNEIAIAISSSIDSPPDVLRQLAAATRELLGMDRSGVTLLDSATQTLNVVAFAGDIPNGAPVRFPLSQTPLCRRLLESGQSLLVEDVDREPQLDVNADVLHAFHVAALILIPLHIGKRRLGLLTVSSSRPRQFTGGDRRLANLLGSQAAVIIGNSELYARMAESMRAQQRLFEQREALFAVNAAVYQAASFHESMEMIVGLAPGVLNVDLCILTLTAPDDPDRAFVAAITSPFGRDLVGKTFTRRATNGEVVKATRRMLVVEDARRHPGVHPTFREVLDIGSVAYLPLLRTGGDYMGMLVLVRQAVGPFSPEQLNLAELFTVRAAAAIENAQLLDQTRRDADAKAMLLRELNHRVKNNLSSIITLLSLDEPELSPAARQWLDRATDRIRTLARAHDLFSGGVERVRLRDLIERTLPSLSVVRPPDVELRVELNGAADITLRTDKAVSLAMVLHELCYNAIVHGLYRRGEPRGGIIHIRGRLDRADDGAHELSEPSRVVIEVVDERANGSTTDGGGIPPPPPVGRIGTGGMGLLLVDGLVTRELGGSFSLTTPSGTDNGGGDPAGGGSVAHIEFPVALEPPGPGSL